MENGPGQFITQVGGIRHNQCLRRQQAQHLPQVQPFVSGSFADPPRPQQPQSEMDERRDPGGRSGCLFASLSQAGFEFHCTRALDSRAVAPHGNKAVDQQTPDIIPLNLFTDSLGQSPQLPHRNASQGLLKAGQSLARTFTTFVRHHIEPAGCFEPLEFGITRRPSHRQQHQDQGLQIPPRLAPPRGHGLSGLLPNLRREKLPHEFHQRLWPLQSPQLPCCFHRRSSMKGLGGTIPSLRRTAIFASPT